jgi:hypothetical protein
MVRIGRDEGNEIFTTHRYWEIERMVNKTGIQRNGSNIGRLVIEELPQVLHGQCIYLIAVVGFRMTNLHTNALILTKWQD